MLDDGLWVTPIILIVTLWGELVRLYPFSIKEYLFKRGISWVSKTYDLLMPIFIEPKSIVK